jgi:hypothetical protein
MALNKPQAEILSKLSRQQLLDFIDTLQKNWWNLQNNWMAYMNREYGQEAAVKADGHCFGANAKVQVHRFKGMFGLKDDLPSMMDALALSTIFANGEYEMRKVDETRFRLRVTNCFQQVRRVEEGLGELACKPAGMTICEAAAGVINPAIRVKCLVCPPDEHPADVWCEWEFELRR